MIIFRSLVPYIAAGLVGCLVGGYATWIYKDRQLKNQELEYLAEMSAQKDEMLAQYAEAVSKGKELQRINEENIAKNEEKLREALDENDGLRRDLANRPVVVRIKAGSCSAVPTDTDATGSGTVSVEVADDLRQDLFDLRESILRDQAALKERDDWIALIKDYSLHPPSQ